MSLPVIDLVFFVIIFAFAIIGLINGFINEVLGKVIPVASIWIAFMTFGHLVPPIEKQLKIHVLAVICSFLIVFVAVFIVLKIFQKILKTCFRAEILNSLDRFLGFVFGIAEGLAVVCILLLILKIQPWFDVSSVTKGSLFVKFIDPLISIPASSISEAVGKVSVMFSINGAVNV